MKSIVLSWMNIHEFGSLWFQQHENRKREFVDELAWDIPHDQTVEADQYDRFDSHYVVVFDNGQLLGNARLLNTANVVKYGHHQFSYMVRDAYLGLLPGIGKDITNYAPQDVSIWEMSRFQACSTAVSHLIFKTAFNFLREKKAKETVSFTRSGFAPYLTKIGLPSCEIGPRKIMRGKPYSVIKTNLKAS